MNTIISATEARNNFFELLKNVSKGGEYTVELNGEPKAKISPISPAKSPEEVEKILSDVRKVFAKSAKRKYWSVLDTPAWKKKERKYLENLSKGIVD